jgi:hypothetical protein
MSGGGWAAFLAKKIADGTLPTDDLTLPTGSEVLWSKHDKVEVPVVCGWQEHQGERERRLKITSVLFGMKSNPAWAGYCQKCSVKVSPKNNKLRPGVWKLEDGYVDFDKRDDKKRPWCFCNICRTGKYKKAPYAKGSTGRCRKCQKLIVGDRIHPSKAIVHRGKRDPKNRERVEFTCSNPECCPGCNQKHYVYLAHTLREKWLGRCSECFQKLPHHRLRTGTEKVGCFDATLDWDDRDDTDKPAITCPVLLCGKKWYADLSTIANGRAKPDWIACCPDHYHGKTLLLSMIARQRATGRPAKITVERLRAGVKKIKGKATQAKLAKNLQVGESAIRKFLGREGLTWEQIKRGEKNRE